MKFHYLFLVGFCFIFILLGVSQEVAADPAKAQPLLYNDSFFAKTWYQFPDGSSVSYKKVRSLVSEVPANASLMKQEKGWRIASYILSGLLIASAGVMVTYQSADLPHGDIILSTAIGTELISFPFCILAGLRANSKLQRSVDNYNLYIMGIGIK